MFRFGNNTSGNNAPPQLSFESLVGTVLKTNVTIMRIGICRKKVNREETTERWVVWMLHHAFAGAHSKTHKHTSPKQTIPSHHHRHQAHP